MSINIKVTPKPIQIKVANLIYQAGANNVTSVNVTSVNGKKSDVILTASDVGAESIGAVQALSDALQPQINDVVSLAQTNQLNIGNKADQVDLESTNAAVEINRLALLTKADIATLTTLAQLVDTKADQSYVVSEIARITGNAPAALDTLAEIAEQLGNDQTQINNLLDQIGNRVRFDAAQALTAPQQTQVRDNINAEAKGVAASLVSGVTTSSIGAATAAQGAKADTAVQPEQLKPVATTGAFADLTGKSGIFGIVYSSYQVGANLAFAATDSLGTMLGKAQGQIDAIFTALSGKEPSIVAGTVAQYWRGDKTWQTLPSGSGGVTLTEVTTEIRKYIGSTGGSPYPSISDSTSNALGHYAATGTGGYQIAFGHSATGTGGGATAVGANAQAQDTYGASFGSYAQAGERSLSGGSFAYSSNSGTALGFSANASNNSTAVGRQADAGSNSNATVLGYQATVTGANQVQLGNSSTTTYTYGAVQNRSDARDKTDIQDCDLGLDFINALQPKKWKWDYREDYAQVLFVLPDQPVPVDLPDDATEDDYNAAAAEYQQAFVDWQIECQTVRDQRALWMADPVKDGSKTRQRYHSGLIAQEVKTTLDALAIDWGGYQNHEVNGGQPVQSIGYNELIAPMLKAIQELSARVQQLEQR